MFDRDATVGMSGTPGKVQGGAGIRVRWGLVWDGLSGLEARLRCLDDLESLLHARPGSTRRSGGIMTATQMPKVQECSVTSCSYNADSSCNAGAITIVGDHAHCGTFVEISFRGGLEDRV